MVGGCGGFCAGGAGRVRLPLPLVLGGLLRLRGEASPAEALAGRLCPRWAAGRADCVEVGDPAGLPLAPRLAWWPAGWRAAGWWAAGRCECGFSPSPSLPLPEWYSRRA